MMATHGHPHGDGHSPHDYDAGGYRHGSRSFGKAFAIGTVLNTAFVAAEVTYGLAAHSMALLADAAHNSGDVLGLLIAWGAAILAKRAPTRTRTYGWGRTTILASLINAIVLLLGCGAIAVEAVGRFGEPVPVGSATVIWVAAIGIAVNGSTALMFMRGRKGDLNIEGAFLHMAADAAVSAGVVVAGLLIMLTGWLWIDPLTSLVIVAAVIAGTWSLLRDSVNLALDALPAGIDIVEVEKALRDLPGVLAVHDLHVWGLSTTETALTVHLVHDGEADEALVQRACAEVRARFAIGHSTIQLERPESVEDCTSCPTC